MFLRRFLQVIFGYSSWNYFGDPSKNSRRFPQQFLMKFCKDFFGKSPAFGFIQICTGILRGTRTFGDFSGFSLGIPSEISMIFHINTLRNSSSSSFGASWILLSTLLHQEFSRGFLQDFLWWFLGEFFRLFQEFLWGCIFTGISLMVPPGISLKIRKMSPPGIPSKTSALQNLEAVQRCSEIP